jgi:hypothetical protein
LGVSVFLFLLTACLLKKKTEKSVSALWCLNLFDLFVLLAQHAKDLFAFLVPHFKAVLSPTSFVFSASLLSPRVDNACNFLRLGFF